MRVLFLTQILPFPLDAGPKIRAYYVLRHLAQAHDVTLVSFVRPSDTEVAVDHLAEFCEAVHTVPMVRSAPRDLMHLTKSLVTNQPFIIVRDWVPEMARLLTDVVHSASPPFDAVHADQLWMAPYALMAKNLGVNGSTPMSVLDQHNAVYMIPQRLASAERNPLKRLLLQFESRKMSDYEAAAVRQFDRVTWVTDDDYDAVARCAGEESGPLPNDGVIPICGDPMQEGPIRRQPDGRRVTFLGGLHYPPNAQGVLWFCRHVFPRVLEKSPDALLTIIGKLPPGGLGPIDIPPANLEITGYVDDPKPYLAETAAFIVPLLAGGGMRVKIIDAWTWGLPIVSTSIGAEGIEYRAHEHLLLADSAEEFALATIELLTCVDLGARLACTGRYHVEERYNWHSTYTDWDRVYQQT